MNDIDPIVGNWYRNLETQTNFEIVALDEQTQSIEIQYFEGEVEELDTDDWYGLVLESIAAPEDWSGAYDDMEPDDLGYSDILAPNSQTDPLQGLD